MKRRRPTPPATLNAAANAWNNKAREAAPAMADHLLAALRALRQMRGELRYFGDLEANYFTTDRSTSESSASTPEDPIAVLRSLCARLDHFESALAALSEQAAAVCDQGGALIQDYSAMLAHEPPPPETKRKRAQPAPEETGDGADIAALNAELATHKAEIAALTEQLAEARKTRTQPAKDDAAPKWSNTNIELQRIQGLPKKKHAAAVPVNASYYRRILEAASSPDGHKTPMGEILTGAGIITQRQLKKALRHQGEGQRRPLGALLVELGFTEECAIAQALAAQLDLPYVVLARERVRENAISCVPVHLARRYSCFPLFYNDHALTVAMANPLDLIALEDLFIASGRQIRPCVASRKDIDDHIEMFYR